MHSTPDGVEVVASLDPRSTGPQPLLVVNRVVDFLDANGLGTGPIRWQRIGDGQSNVTFRISRGDLDLVLRRGPRPPLPPSTHDMVREATIQRLLAVHRVPVPQILAVCEDAEVLGVPFYVMQWLHGVVITAGVPAELDTPDQRRLTSQALVACLAHLHTVDTNSGPLAGLGRPDGYLARQVRRFSDLWELTSTRHLSAVARIAEWLDRNRPASPKTSLVHGDYRLGNVMYRRTAPATPMAILDWEMATLGDPLSDLGYLTATWADPDSSPIPLHLSPVTTRIGYLTSRELAADYAAHTGLDLSALPWYQTLALWKAAIFCEAIYARWLKGERPHDTTFAPGLAAGVPALLAAAEQRARAVR
jgi:aminoglycoside phosphotransferase (APT) family kinase protein